MIVVNRRLYRDLHPEDTTTEADDLTLVTIHNLFFKGRYNDLGFMVGNRLLILVEAQTTWSYNILVRFLLYLSETYDRYITSNKLNLYGSKPLELPVPELFVIYVGEPRDDIRDHISLSRDIFKSEGSDLEITVHVIASDVDGDITREYIIYCRIFSEQVRKYGYTRKAVEETIRICRNMNILAEYMAEKEVASRMMLDMDADYWWELTLRDERQEGRAEGREEGRDEGREETLAELMPVIEELQRENARLRGASEDQNCN